MKRNLHRYFINIFQSIRSSRTMESALKVWLTFFCSIKLWIWNLFSVICETLKVVLILRKWQLIAYIESFKWSNIATKLINTKFVRRIKKVFLESEANLKTFKKFLVHNGVSYKFVFKSVKSLTRIFWMIEYWWKAQKQEHLVMNAKPFFWESEAIFETFSTCRSFL